MIDPDFIEARHYSRGRRRADVDLIVIHTVEAHERIDTAENVARWFASDQSPKASAHYVIDSDSVVCCVREEFAAWHANEVNGRSIGLEHAGFARQSHADWADEYSVAMLEKSAELAAHICARWDIPIVRLMPSEVKNGRGFCGHVDVNAAYGRVGGHWDPGPHFPYPWYLERVAAYFARLSGPLPVEDGRAGGGMLALEGVVDSTLAARDSDRDG